MQKNCNLVPTNGNHDKCTKQVATDMIQLRSCSKKVEEVENVDVETRETTIQCRRSLSSNLNIMREDISVHISSRPSSRLGDVENSHIHLISDEDDSSCTKPKVYEQDKSYSVNSNTQYERRESIENKGCSFRLAPRNFTFDTEEITNRAPARLTFHEQYEELLKYKSDANPSPSRSVLAMKNKYYW